MSDSQIEQPELIIGLVAPIGANLDRAIDALEDALHTVRYQSSVIKVTDHLSYIDNKTSPDSQTFIGAYTEKIERSNEVRREHGDDAMACLAVHAIQQERRLLRGNTWQTDSEKTTLETQPHNRRAYIIRQLKRPEEIKLLRKIYGRQFILISAYAPSFEREKEISRRQRSSDQALKSDHEYEAAARELVRTDADEGKNSHGQNVIGAFQLADFFVDVTRQDICTDATTRFINLLFGDNQISPSFSEYGMYLAKSASLRSSDLSRQVGAAIFDDARCVISLGCNDVPKFGGGTYWEDHDGDDGRDSQRGADDNEEKKNQLVADVISRLIDNGAIQEAYVRDRSPQNIAAELLKDRGERSLSSSKLMDIIEFGRMVHAEMNAITDAARKNLSTQGSTLFTTTFPCHMCARLIIASGIGKVVYVEPYPKSYAADQHPDAISVDHERDDRVSFMPFMGVSPFRYRDLFQKGKRKSSGKAHRWYKGEPSPLIEVLVPNYEAAELKAKRRLLSTDVH